MRHPTFSRSLAAVLLAGLVGGCQSTSHENAYPKDPLLATKKPVEGKSAPSTGPVLMATAEPAVPPLPAAALATNTKPAGDAGQAGSRLFMPIPTQKGPTVATPAVRSSTAPAAEDLPGSRRQVPGKYGHAPDYVWLQGVLDKHYQGRMDLRYCDPSVADRWGGKVCLEEDPRLSQFQEGDVVLVEGELVSDTDTTKKVGWKHFPRYRIREAWLVEHKSR